MEQWQDTDIDDCPVCGSSIQILTDDIFGNVHDGDSARCMDCDFIGGMSVCGETGDTWVQDP